MRKIATPLTGAIALAAATAALAMPQARQFTQGIGVYERSIGQALEAARWRITGTKREFRSGRTLVFCLAPSARRGSTRERIQATMRRVSASKIRIRITFLNALTAEFPPS